MRAWPRWALQTFQPLMRSWRPCCEACWPPALPAGRLPAPSLPAPTSRQAPLFASVSDVKTAHAPYGVVEAAVLERLRLLGHKACCCYIITS